MNSLDIETEFSFFRGWGVYEKIIIKNKFLANIRRKIVIFSFYSYNA